MNDVKTEQPLASSANTGVASAPENSGWRIGILVLVAALGLAVGFLGSGYMNRNTVKQEVYTLDTQRLIDAKLVDLVIGGMKDKDYLAREGRAFDEQLQVEISKMAGPGIVILNRQAVILPDDAMDLTDMLAKKLKVDLSKSLTEELKRQGAL